MSSNRSLSWYSPIQIRLFLGMAACLVFAFFVAKQIGHSDVKIPLGLLGLGALFALMLRLGKKVWLVFAFGMNIDVPAPVAFGKSFTFPEALCLLVVVQALFQMGMRRQYYEVFRFRNTFFLLYCGWVMLVLVMNPIGFAIFGSDVVGGRFYFQLFLVTIVFLILASGEVDEKSARWFILLNLFSTIINTIYWAHAWRPMDMSFDGAAGEEDYYSWHQVLAIPGSVAVKFLFAHYSLNYFLSLTGMRWIPVIVGAYVVILLSGKRMAVATAVATPFFTTLMRKQWALGVMAAVSVAVSALILAQGQGRFYELPMTVQRAISYLPGKWKPAADLGAEDPYRKTLRDEAMDRIRQHPFIGRGISVSVNDYWVDRIIGSEQITGNLAGGSWHTTWLGYSADFGIPAAFFWGFILIQMTILSCRVARGFPEGTLLKTMSGFILITLCSLWMNSWTSGHSVQDPLNYWWLFALLFPLQRKLVEVKREQEVMKLRAQLQEARKSAGFPGFVQHTSKPS